MAGSNPVKFSILASGTDPVANGYVDRVSWEHGGVVEYSMTTRRPLGCAAEFAAPCFCGEHGGNSSED